MTMSALTDPTITTKPTILSTDATAITESIERTVPTVPTVPTEPDPFGDWDTDTDPDPDDWGEELPAAQINDDLDDDDLDDDDDAGGFLGDDRGMSTIEYALGCVAAAALGALLYLVVTSDTVETALSGIFERALETK